MHVEEIRPNAIFFFFSFQNAILSLSFYIYNHTAMSFGFHSQILEKGAVVIPDFVSRTLC